jgi:alpha-ribazole phosphatase/probable phosphoglycerate mutase
VSRLVLVRHAEPVEEARGRCYGTLDVGLSPAGVEASERLALTLAELELDAVYTSPRARAVETIRPFAASCGLTPVVHEGLREIDFGELEGRRYEEIEASHPELYRAWMDAPTTVRFPGGESYDDLRVRALQAFEEIRARQGSALVVTHGGVIRAGLAAWLEMPAHAIFRLGQSHCGITIVEWIEETPVVRLVNGASTR